MRSSAAMAGTLACLFMNLPVGRADAASPWFCGLAFSAAPTGQWIPPWLPQPGPTGHDLSCHLMTGCRREEQGEKN